MGGKLSCMGSPRSEKEVSKQQEIRANQYEEIDDSFAIISGNSDSNNTHSDDSAGNGHDKSDRVNKTVPVAGVNYENFTPPGNARENNNRSPNKSGQHSPAWRNGNGHHVTSEKVAISSSEDGNAKYENVVIKPKLPFKLKEIQNAPTRPANHNTEPVSTSSHSAATNQSKSASPTNQSPPKFSYERPSTTAANTSGSKGVKLASKEADASNSNLIYAQVDVTSLAKTGAEKPRFVPKIKETTSPHTNNSTSLLNYVEVEFAAPPSSKRSDLSSATTSNNNKVADGAMEEDKPTTYSHVRNEGGRIVLYQ